MPEQPHRLGPVSAELKIADCAACPHRDSLRAAGRCSPGDTCLMVESGRQIDRFLRSNPSFADACLRDPFWERRAIAVRYAPLDAIAGMVDDRDEVVRRAVALRLKDDDLLALLRDPDREVRITVADRLPPARLTLMLGDADYQVRVRVAHRLPHGKLPKLADDPEREVRKEVARRLPPFALDRLAGDADAEVRRIVAGRALPALAARLLVDEDWLVRRQAVLQAATQDLVAVIDDPEADVRELARGRLAGMLSDD